MKPPAVRELDIIKGALIVSSWVLKWQESSVENETDIFNDLENAVNEYVKLIRRFKREQLL